MWHKCNYVQTMFTFTSASRFGTSKRQRNPGGFFTWANSRPGGYLCAHCRQPRGRQLDKLIPWTRNECSYTSRWSTCVLYSLQCTNKIASFAPYCRTRIKPIAYTSESYCPKETPRKFVYGVRCIDSEINFPKANQFRRVSLNLCVFKWARKTLRIWPNIGTAEFGIKHCEPFGICLDVG